MQENLMNPSFSHIYLERAVDQDPRWPAPAAQIPRPFPRATCIPIEHHKDVFNRRHQSYPTQHRTQALILAVKHGRSVYPGAPVCQSVGEEHF